MNRQELMSDRIQRSKPQRATQGRDAAPKKKVALFIHKLAGRSGGAERIFIELANMLVARGYDVTCIHDDRRLDKPFYELDRRVELINISMRGKDRYVRRLWRLQSNRLLPAAWRNRIEWTAQNKRRISQLHDYFRLVKPDVAISFLPPANTPALLASVETDVKVIPTNHNVPAEDYTNPGRWSPNPYDQMHRLEALRHATAVHVIFPDFAEWFPQHVRDKIVAVPNYISKDILQSKPRPDREKTILGVGRIAEVKNYRTLLKAWRLIADDHPDWKVVIYGDGPESDVLAQEVEEARLTDSFLLPGTKAHLGEEYGRMSIFCHPAHFEGFGLAPAEALALGMPVVAFADCAGVNQFVRDGYNGLLADRAGSHTALAEALQRLMNDDALRRSLAANGPESVSHFTEENFANAWVDIIEQVTRPESPLNRRPDPAL